MSSSVSDRAFSGSEVFSGSAGELASTDVGTLDDGNPDVGPMDDSVGGIILDWVQRYYTPALVGFGTLGNCLSVIVFFSTKLRKLSSSYYLSALAISDTGYLFCTFLSWLNVANIDLFNKPGICEFSIYLTQNPKKKRAVVRFLPADDILLLKQVLEEMPYRCNGATWKHVASKLSTAIGKDVSPRAVRDRTDSLLVKFCRDEKAILRKSGTEEQYTEREVLLEELARFREDFRNVAKANGETKRGTAAGQLMRQAAAQAMITEQANENVDVCSFLSVWFIVAFTVERFVAVRYPLKRPSMCTVTRAKIVLICISLGASVGYMPYIFIVEVVNSDMNGTNVSICGPQEDQMDMVTTLNHIDTVVNLVVPFLTIIILNTMIARTVCRVARVRRRMTKGATSNHPTRGSRTTSSQTKVTEMLLVVSTVFITLNLPYYMLRLWLYVTDGYKPMEEQDQNVIAIQQFFYVLLQTNFGINFGLYCVSGQNFRRALLSLFRPEYSRRGGDASQVTECINGRVGDDNYFPIVIRVVSEYCRSASTRRTFTVNGSWREAHELVPINRMTALRSNY